ncbi:MAG: S8 family serine peptidase [Bacteroidales bacterium]|nr:S8 family serine peptidase [Bacteroidales bacterium]MBN2750164.1 S8 family serine peptidase [Bacteroidales bacterium]
MKRILLATLLTLSLNGFSQSKYFIAFTNKSNSTYSTENPSDFLSPTAISRRERQGISVTTQDLPVNQQYIDAVIKQGAMVKYPLKWFNGVVAEIPSSAVTTAILGLDFVASVSQIFDPAKQGTPLSEFDFGAAYQSKSTDTDRFSYGSAAQQIKMLNGHILHNQGFTGKGMTIAVLDAGFRNVNTLTAFDSLRNSQRLLGTKDFVNPAANIYLQHSHGTVVLSTMAGLIPNTLVGTAPHASYWLIRTEDTNSEQLIEEYNWAAGAEFADSVGADVINSSLGYTTFDVTSQNHTYAELDGNTAPSTKAANIAAQKGMVVVISAGNDGDSPWRYISAPADATGVLTVGATTSTGQPASFSSVGPSADGRIKPDIAAMGVNTAVQNIDGSIGTTNGTSLSAPVISGLVACLWQAHNSYTATEIVEQIKANASQSQLPNNTLGYGLPNFGTALSTNNMENSSAAGLRIYPNPFDTTITLTLPNATNKLVSVTVVSVNGQRLVSQVKNASNGLVELILPKELSSGLYLINVTYDTVKLSTKALKL